MPNKESELFQLLERNRLGIGSLFSNIASTRGQLTGQQGRSEGLFDETGRLREDIFELLGEVRPGFGRLTEAAVETVRNRFSESVGNLREALGKRGLQGSSFAINETRRAELDFAQEEERVRSEAFLQEIDLRRQLIGDAGNLIQLDLATLQTQAMQVGLQLGLNEQEAGVFRDELVNIQSQAALLGQRIARELQELGLAGNIINQQQAIVAQLATAQAQLTAQAAADSGSLFGSIFGSLAGIAASAVAPAAAPVILGGSTLLSSDRRLKRDIIKIGQRPDGLNVYVFRYLWSTMKHIGVMADEVLKVKPEAVFVMPSGYFAVDYGRL